MAIALDPEARNVAWKRARRILFKQVCSPPFILFYILAFSGNYWILPSLRLLLSSFLQIPSGWPVWALAIILASSFVGGFVYLIVSAVRANPKGKAARKARLAGDIEEFRKLSEEAARIRTKPFFLLWTGCCAVQLLIPIAAALSLWQYMQSPMSLKKENGKMRYATPQEQLRMTLKSLEKPGDLWHS